MGHLWQMGSYPKIGLGTCSISEARIGHAVITVNITPNLRQLPQQGSFLTEVQHIGHGMALPCFLLTLRPRLREQPHLNPCWSLWQKKRECGEPVLTLKAVTLD